MATRSPTRPTWRLYTESRRELLCARVDLTETHADMIFHLGKLNKPRMPSKIARPEFADIDDAEADEAI